MRKRFWIWIKIALLAMAFAHGVSSAQELGEPGAGPSVQMTPVFFLCGFVLGISCRLMAKSEPWTEGRLWKANSFFLFTRPPKEVWRSIRDNNPEHVLPFWHFGAWMFMFAGIGALLEIVVERQSHSLGVATTFGGIGLGVWFGLRLPDFLLRQKNVGN